MDDLDTSERLRRIEALLSDIKELLQCMIGEAGNYATKDAPIIEPLGDQLTRIEEAITPRPAPPGRVINLTEEIP